MWAWTYLFHDRHDSLERDSSSTAGAAPERTAAAPPGSGGAETAG